nr:transglycosylase domain-containing protein [Anaerolineae bacterium]
MASTVIIRRNQRRRSSGGGSPWLQMLVTGLMFVGIAVGAVVAAGAAVGLSVYAYFAKDLPAPEQIEEMTLTSFETSKIYDRSGEHLLWEVVDPQQGDRSIVPFSEIPVHMRDATIALEDKTFYTNPGGINFEGLARAFVNNLMGQHVQGGSSITAQLVKNVAMDPEERYVISYERKIKEAILSVELTRRYPGVEGRDRILEWYLNTVSYGKTANGVEAAAKLYFGKHAKEMTLAECAMLAAVPQYPAMNPIDNPEAAKSRQALALQAMVNEGYITPAEAEAAKRAPVGRPKPTETADMQAPHFVTYLLQVLEQRYGRRAVYGGGLRVISSLDYDLQKDAEEIVKTNIDGWAAEHQARNAAAVVIRPATGELLAMVGSADFHDKTIDGQVNMAVEPRQPGSSFKPYTYAAAFEQGYAPGTVVNDVRTAFPIEGAAPYEPENFDLKFHGPMMLRSALACSYNIPAVWLLERIGIDSALEMAHRLGVTTLRSHYGLALTLGSGEVTLLDHTYAFSVFANGGVMAGTPVPESRREPGFRQLDPVSVLKVTDGRGQVIDEFKGPAFNEVISPQVAYLITNILSDDRARVPAYGYGSALVLSRPAAAKTGTTNSYMDAWTMGYNPQVAVGVWMGNSDYTPMTSMWGGRGAAPIWHDIMERAFSDLPEVDFAEPAGITWMTVDADSGLLPGPHTQRTVREPFIEGREPKVQDSMHKDVAICLESGRLATPYCPPEQLEHQVWPIYPTSVLEWMRSNERPLPPTEYCDRHGPNLRASDASITSPVIYQALQGLVQI